MTQRQIAHDPEVKVVIETDSPVGTEAKIRDRLQTIAHNAEEPIRSCRVRLSRVRGAEVARPVVGQANLDLNGRPLRAQVTAGSIHEAVELLLARVRRRLDRIARFREAHRSGTAKPGEWHSVSEPTFRPAYVTLPGSEPRIVRKKLFMPVRATVDEAAADMELLDHEFHLFTDVATEQDSVIYREGPTGYRLAQVRPEPGRIRPAVVPVTLSPHPAPMLTIEAAKADLDLCGLPFLFFVEPGSGRGNVLYRRYDGHYGLLSPEEEVE